MCDETVIAVALQRVFRAFAKLLLGRLRSRK